MHLSVGSPACRRGELDSASGLRFPGAGASFLFLVGPEWFRTRTTEQWFALPGEFGSELANDRQKALPNPRLELSLFCW